MKYFIACIILICLSTERTLSQSVKERLERSLDRLPHPTSVSDFSSLPHLPSQNQDSTLICWSFTTTSFIESEMKRMGKNPVRLSVIFPVYYEFIEKTKEFVRTKGKSRFNPGDLFSGVLDIVRNYGIVPAAVYEAKEGHYKLNHNALYLELESIASAIKMKENWDEKKGIQLVTKVLQKYLGRPPEKFFYNNKEYTPKSFFSEIVNIPLDDYLCVTSFLYAPFRHTIELRVPDNWRHISHYWNVPLDLFYRSLKQAIIQGYSLAIDMDNSENSYRITKQFAFIPEYDLPKDSITQIKREIEFLSGATTDDHLIHIVSYKQFGSEEWFLAKDSWRTAWEGPNQGYFFLHESYIKLKVLAFLVHKDAIPKIRMFQQK